MDVGAWGQAPQLYIVQGDEARLPGGLQTLRSLQWLKQAHQVLVTFGGELGSFTDILCPPPPPA